MEESNLDWWLFDKNECWRDLHELWTSWELRNGLMHGNWNRKGVQVKGEEMVFELIFGLVMGEKMDSLRANWNG